MYARALPPRVAAHEPPPLTVRPDHEQVVQPDDWRGYVQLLAVVCGGCVSLGALAIYLGEDSAAEEPAVSRDRSLSMDGEITFLEVSANARTGPWPANSVKRTPLYSRTLLVRDCVCCCAELANTSTA